jgi:ketosteroid isomerase-like protein
MRLKVPLIAVAALTAGVLGLPGTAGASQTPDATAQPGRHQEKPAGCCAKHNTGAATDEHATHQPATVIGEDAVVQVVRAWLDAIQKRDTGRIEQLLADDFVAILPDGRKRVKSEHLKEIADGKYAVQTLTMDEANARLFGSVAVVTYYQYEESRTHGDDTTGSSVWTDVLMNRNGTWQIVAEHGSRFK